MKRRLSVPIVREESPPPLPPEIWKIIYEKFTRLMYEYFEEKGGASLHRQCREFTFLAARLVCSRTGTFKEHMESRLAVKVAPVKDKRTGQYYYEEGKDHNYFCRLLQMRIDKERHGKSLPTMDVARYLRWSLLWKTLQEYHVSLTINYNQPLSWLERGCHVI